MDILWVIIQILIGYNLILPFLMYLFSLKKEREETYIRVNDEPDYAIIVTAYEQTELLAPLVNSLLNLNYDNFLVYIIADNCDVSTINFNNEKVILLRPEAVLASNTLSHFYAINRFKRPHERLTIIDSDNLVDPEYLNELNKSFVKGFKAVQGLRAPKKTNTVISQLDSIRDIYYNFYDAKLLFNLGSSSTLSGSGMAFTTELYIQCMRDNLIQGAGFDKVLQASIVRKNERIAFTDKAIVYDEKTSYPQQLIKQRSRWINTWFKYFVFGFDLLKRGFLNKSKNQLLFGLILLRPPLFIFITLSFICLLITIGTKSLFIIYWLVGFLVFFIAFYIALKDSKSSPSLYRALLTIPKFIFLQFVSLLFVKSANRRSVATKH